jgi:Fe(3+) dicitrate transport protein
MHARQRDDYDEQNFLGSYEVQNAGSEQEARDIAAGLAERQFFDLAHCKSCFAPGSGLNTYTGEVWRSQVVHNAYLDENTTVTSRFYAGWHRRDRYQLIGTNAFDPTLPARPAGEAPEVDEAGGEITFGRDTMFGRLRTYRHLGAEVRGEWANQYAFGFKQDFQAGIRYEYQDMTNKNVLGLSGQVLEDGDKGVATFFDRSLEANTVSAFLQTNIYVASDFNVLPGIRFEWFDITRQNRVVADEEGEAEQQGGGVCGATPFGAQCRRIEDLNFDPTPEDGTSSFVALPGVAFAYTGLYRTTVYGGYHRGLTTAVLRNENLPAPDEIGDNFNVGLRSSSIMGFDFEVAGFYHFMHDFQYGESFASVGGDREFGRANEVEIRGVELYGRLNSQPFTGGPLNFFTEGNYTYSQGRFTDAPRFDDDGNVVGSFNGNRIPEVPWHIAALTVGVEGTTGWRWNASATYTYRGAFFTDAANTPFGRAFEVNDEGGGEFEIEEAGEAGQVPSIWLLSARFNLDIGNSGASVFVAGDNLLDELYITDREDGMKPGLGRTIWTGFKYTF